MKRIDKTLAVERAMNCTRYVARIKEDTRVWKEVGAETSAYESVCWVKKVIHFSHEQYLLCDGDFILSPYKKVG
jgi:hypothetical protein